MFSRFRIVTSSLAAAFAAAGFAASAAQAATVSAETVRPSSGAGPTVEILSFQAAPGESNDVTVTVKGGFFSTGWLVNDNTAPLGAGPGCTSLDAHTASCQFTETELTVAVNVNLGDGRDWASVAQACPHNNMDFACRPPTVDGGSGLDTIWGSDTDYSILRGGGDQHGIVAGKAGATVDGGAGNDFLTGSTARDLLLGGTGNDRLSGDAANDRAYGGDGDDNIGCGAGNDTISGGAGRDTMLGWSGRDTFYAKDGSRDKIDGGTWTDRAGIDRGLDATRRVEHVHG